MRLSRIRIANLRAIKAAELRFRSGFNVIIGVNGVGKSSVLDALGVCLSAFVNRANKLRRRALGFSRNDIRVGSEALTVECDGWVGSSKHRYLVHMPREASTPKHGKAGMPREQVHSTPTRASFVGTGPDAVTSAELGGRPLAALFSSNRAVPSERAPRKQAAAGGIAGASADALANRNLRLGELAAWVRAREAQRSQSDAPVLARRAFDEAIGSFLPGYSNLRTDGGDRPCLLIDRDGHTILVRLMSDGERGMIALVLDLARRLVLANSELDNPITESEAVVLIDELELHLHPKWQRQIVSKLQTTFPRCQFIATTHSPQVIGELPHDRIQIMTDGGVHSPTHSFGVDSSRVLEEIMDAPPRNREVEALLAQVSREVGEQRYEKARESLAGLVGKLGENDPEVTRLSTLLDFMEGED